MRCAILLSTLLLAWPSYVVSIRRRVTCSTPALISLPNVYFMKLVEYTARSLRAHGFKVLVASERPQR
jgi:hypothetical protein